MPTPLTLPGVILVAALDFVFPRETARMEGRRTEDASFGEPWWTGRFVLAWETPAERRALDAFATRLLMPGAVFRAFDLRHLRPVMYPAGPLGQQGLVKHGGGAFDGTGPIDSVTDAHTVAISGLPSTFACKAGDRVELVMAEDVISLHTLAADATAVDGVASLSLIEPLATAVFDETATYNLEKPACLMGAAGQVQRPQTVSDRRFSFDGEERFFGVAA